MKCFLAGASGMLGRSILRINERMSNPLFLRACSNTQKWDQGNSDTTEYIQSNLSEINDASIFDDCECLIMAAGVT